jgi:23S rRNA (cytosine1962-C5)-methyltransferase
MNKIFTRVYTEGWQDYELIDAGGGKKLERFGKIILIRPELQAYFQSGLPFQDWNKMAHAEFIEKGNQKGQWKFYKKVEANWLIVIDNLITKLAFTNYKHIGVFPEQKHNWQVLKTHLNAGKSFLNLFAYTGIASLVAKKTGAAVTHVDSVKQLMNWSKENMEINHLSEIKWILDDALKFALREVKRGKKYDGILMDPPAYGLGVNGEKWILEQKLPDLLETSSKLLNDNGFLIMNTYSPKVNNEQIFNIVKSNFKSKHIEINELWSKSKTDKDLFHGNLMYVRDKIS